MKKNLADPIFYRGWIIRRHISPQTKKTLWLAFPKTTKHFMTPVDEMDLLKELIDEAIDELPEHTGDSEDRVNTSEAKDEGKK